jgi:hypothetical protein
MLWFEDSVANDKLMDVNAFGDLKQIEKNAGMHKASVFDELFTVLHHTSRWMVLYTNPVMFFYNIIANIFMIF